MITVQLIDDHAVMRAGVRRLLDGEKGITVVAESGTVREAVRHFSAHQPNVVVLDLTCPAEDGLQATERLREADPAARVIVLSLADNSVYPARFLKVGAKGYLTRACRPEELIRAIRAVAAGEVYLEAKLAQALALRPFSGDADPLDALTEREFQVFRMLAAGRSVKAIAQDLCLSPKTVGACRTRIMRALGAANVAELARTAIRYGLIAA